MWVLASQVSGKAQVPPGGLRRGERLRQVLVFDPKRTRLVGVCEHLQLLLLLLLLLLVLLLLACRYIVEMEVVLPAEMTVQESHDISLELQHKVGW